MSDRQKPGAFHCDLATAHVLAACLGGYVGGAIWLNRDLDIPLAFSLGILILGSAVGALLVRAGKTTPNPKAASSQDRAPESPSGSTGKFVHFWVSRHRVSKTIALAIGLIFAGFNLLLRTHRYEGAALEQFSFTTMPFTAYRRGWPLPFYEMQFDLVYFSFAAILVNLAVGLILAVAVALICEWAISSHTISESTSPAGD